MVTKAGRVLERGFETFQAAWAWANAHVAGMEGHRHSSRTPAPAFEVRPDAQYGQQENRIWREGNRHTVVTRP